MDIRIPIEIKIMIDGFYTLNIALQDLIGQPQFEMIISFRVSSAKFQIHFDFKKKMRKLTVDDINFTFTIVDQTK